MAIKVIEGRWEEVASQVKLAGKRVKIIYPDYGSDGVTVVDLGDPQKYVKTLDQASLLQSLLELSKQPRPPGGPVDVDRDRIFRELHGDPG